MALGRKSPEVAGSRRLALGAARRAVGDPDLPLNDPTNLPETGRRVSMCSTDGSCCKVVVTTANNVVPIREHVWPKFKQLWQNWPAY